VQELGKVTKAAFLELLHIGRIKLHEIYIHRRKNSVFPQNMVLRKKQLLSM